MTEKNADVEWLRHEVTLGTALIVGRVRARRILAHIDQLEAERVKDQLRIGALQSSVDGCAQRLAAEVSRRGVHDDRRPTVHEIAAQMMAAIQIDQKSIFENVQDLASLAYDAAEALVAEGRRRDGTL